MYFPPSSATWATADPASLGWCVSEWDTLDDYLEQANSKGFMILYRGKIAYEQYYGTFNQNSTWYWASAAKSLTAFLTGKAQEEGLLDINDKTSDYLGNGWSVCPPAKEDLITIRHQLTMTTGLDYNVPDFDCTIDTCLQYKADAGTQWYYHNAPYLLVKDVIEAASGQTINAFTYQYVLQQTGMSGLWVGTNTFYSNVRSMARFGHLVLNHAVWDGDTVMHDQVYFQEMINTSQNLNPAYGYLWWLNGKSQYMQPGTAFVFPGKIIPSAPGDLFMAAGLNDQRIYVVPSLDLVVVRVGDAADSSQLALSGFDNNLWKLVMNLVCTPTSLEEHEGDALNIYPNPAGNYLEVEGWEEGTLKIWDHLGREMEIHFYSGRAEISHLPEGIYLLKDKNSGAWKRFIKN